MRQISIAVLFLIILMGISPYVPLPSGISFSPNVAEAYTNTYYVATTGNNAWPGTIGSPMATIEYAAGTAAANSIVYVRAGTYSPTTYISPNSGSSGNPIVFQNYNGEAVEIDGSGYAQASGRGIWDLNGDDYVTIDGFEIHSSDYHGVNIESCDNVTVQNCTIHDCGWSGVWAYGNPAFSCTDVTIYGNTVYDCERSNVQEYISLRYVDGFEISYNTVYETSYPGADTIGIDMLGSKNGTTHHNDTSGVTFGIYLDNWASTVDNYIYIYNNITHHHLNGNGISINAESGGIVRYVYIYNNVSHDNTYHGFKISHNATSYNHIYIDNNSTYNNGSYCLQIVEDGANIDNLYVRNNSFDSSTANNHAAIFANGGYTSAKHHFSYNLFRSTTEYGTDIINADPLYTDPGTDCSIGATSPLVDSGTTIAYITFDYSGVSRPQGGVYDVGAYEYTASTTDQAEVLADTSDLTYVIHPGGATLIHTGKYKIDTSGMGAGNVGTVTMYTRASVGSPTGTAYLTASVYLSGNSITGAKRTLTGTITEYSDILTRPGGGTWSVTDLGNAEWWLTVEHTVPSWTYGGIVHQMYVGATFVSSSGSTHTVSQAITTGTTNAISCTYDGVTQVVHTDSGTDSQPLVTTIFDNTSPVHIAEFDGRIDEVRITSAGTTVLYLEFEPEDIGESSIQDKTANDNDVTFTLAANDSCETVEIGKSKSTSEIIPLVTELEKQEYLNTSWHEDAQTNEEIDNLGENNPFFPIVDMIYQFSGIPYWMSWMSIYLLVLLVSLAWVLRHTNSHIAIAAATGLLVTVIFYAWGQLIPWGLVAMWVLAAMLSVILERRQTI